MTKTRSALTAFTNWYANLRTYGSSGGPARGTIGAALVVLERLKTDFNLDLTAQRAGGEGQIRGVSGAAVAQILRKFGESRRFLGEGGRTNRGAAGEIGAMLEAISPLGLEHSSNVERVEVLTALQQFLIVKVRDYHNRQRLRIVYDPTKSTWYLVHDLLNKASESSKEAPVAQHLVGAKLQQRFPTTPVENHSHSTADEQTNRPGDFTMGDAVFHVTITPNVGHYSKCKENLEDGKKVWLLVPDRQLAGARQNAENTAPGQIAVESIESFVSQNVEEQSEFIREDTAAKASRLLELYNSRVDAVELDKSVMIDIPSSLRS